MHGLITGGAGFIGTNAARMPNEAWQTCSRMDNFYRQGASHNRDYLSNAFGLTVDYLDVRFPEQVNAYWPAHGDIGAILHLACQVSLVASLANPRYDFEANTFGPFNVLEPRAVFCRTQPLSMPAATEHTAFCAGYESRRARRGASCRTIQRDLPKTCRLNCMANAPARKARTTSTGSIATGSTA
jgi:NAD-dependent epimerase/dehydratase family protein